MKIIKNNAVFNMDYGMKTNVCDQKANVRDQNQFETTPKFCIRYILKPINGIVVYQGLTEVNHVLQICMVLSYLGFKKKQHRCTKCCDLFFAFINLPYKKCFTPESNFSPNDRKISRYEPHKK